MKRFFNLNFENNQFTKKGKKPDFEFKDDIIVYFETSNIQHMGLM